MKKKEEKQNEKRGKAKFSENPFFWDLVPRFSSSQCDNVVWIDRMRKSYGSIKSVKDSDKKEENINLVCF